MAISRVQFAVGGGDASQGTSVGATFGSNVTAGSLIVVGIRNETLPTGISDSLGTSYSVAVTDDGTLAGVVRMRMYYGIAPSSGANTVTLTFSATNYVFVAAVEVSGITGTSPLDATGQISGGATADVTIAGISTVQADEYVCMMASANTFVTYTAGTDFTLVDGTIPTNSNNFGGVQEYITSGTLSSYTAHFTPNASVAPIAVLATFKGGEAVVGVSWLPQSALVSGQAFIAVPTGITPPSTPS